MTKKCYAAIMCAKELTAEIQNQTNTVLNGGKVTLAYSTIKKIAELNDKYVREFKDVDPSWMPPNYQPPVRNYPTQAAPAIAYEETVYE